MVILSTSLITPAAAANEHEDFVQNLGQEALTTLDQDVSQDKLAGEMRDWLNTYFDTDTIARFTLGRYWRQATDEQKEEYTTLFNELIVTTYSRRLQEYSGEDFKVSGHTSMNDRDTLVHSKIIPADNKGPSTQVDWRVRKIDGKKKIIDVVVEGVSMSVTQRKEFASVIQKNGGKIDALLKSLREKTQG